MKQAQRDALHELETALHHHRAGRFQQAEAIYKKMPHNPDALHLRGVIAHQLNRNDEAVELVNKAIRISPSNAAYYFSLDMVCRAMNRLDDAVAGYQRLLARVPNNAVAHNNLGNAFRDQGRRNEAADCYQKAIALNPDFTDAYNNLAVVLADQGGADAAIGYYQNALMLDPNNAEVHANLGLALKRLGKLDEAVASYRKALELKPEFAAAYSNLGNVLVEQGELDQAVTCLQKATELKPDDAAFQVNLGNGFKAQGKLNQAVECYRNALALRPDFAEAHANLGSVLKEQSKLEEAIACYRQAIALKPDFVEAYNNLGLIHAGQGQADAAMECYRAALAIKPDFADSHNNLGNAFYEKDELEQAIACYRKATALRPGDAILQINLGNALRKQGHLDDAANCYLNALALKPAHAEAVNNLGMVFAMQGKHAEAIECYQTAITLDPNYAEAHNNLGIEFKDRGQTDEAIACFENALTLKFNFASAYNNLGLMLHSQGKPDEAIDHYRNALAYEPDFAGAYSNLLFTMQYSAAYAPEEVFNAHVEFAKQFETSLKSQWRPHSNSQDRHRRLKVGYVSPDFRKHPVAYSIEPILASHDKSQFEIYCYYNHAESDEVTKRLQAQADHWVPCPYLSDNQLAERIRADGIDILIDLTGHTGGNRLLTFARKPAPVQATYLGHPATTGLTAIDYRITDTHAEPPGMTEHLNVEQLWRLPEIFCCYRALNSGPEVIDHPPAEDNGYVTFGCFNNFSKVTDPVLSLWAQLLDRVPTARLMLEIAGIDNADFRADVESRCAQLGIPLERLILIPRKKENQYVLYNRIDIALDPFPCNGGTTSLDSVWMGVPFVTLAGGHFSSRLGVTVLTNAGLSQLIANDEKEYLEIASTLAQDHERLKAVRADLRKRVEASPLMDARRITTHLEQAYRGMWEKWCETVPVQ